MHKTTTHRVPLMVLSFILLAALALAGCASTEGPGTFTQTRATGQQPVAQTTTAQTVPQQVAVTSQTLAAPNAVQSGSVQGGRVQTDGLQTGGVQPGGVSPRPTLQDFANQDLSAQDFSIQDLSINEPARDAFGNLVDQRPVQTGNETFQDTVQRSLEPQAVAPDLVATAPRFPKASIAPISTAPEPHATQLFDAIDDAMFQRGMQLAFFGDETAQYVVRSQVSAIPSDTVTSVIYVFDIFDTRGNLRHRVSGARAIQRTGPNGWELVDSNTTALIADEVAGRLVAWFQQNPT
ncbi:MAG: hypothetical protein AAF590_03110 [Pseudomonadota bacterium]